MCIDSRWLSVVDMMKIMEQGNLVLPPWGVEVRHSQVRKTKKQKTKNRKSRAAEVTPHEVDHRQAIGKYGRTLLLKGKSINRDRNKQINRKEFD